MGRAPCCDKAKVKRGPWSPDEDELLKTFIHQHGTGGNWISLPPKAGLRRCGKSCRLRWLNYLRPDIRHGGFTEEEDRVICSLYNEIGSRWSVIAAQLQGRTDNDVKNHWNTKLKKKILLSIKEEEEANNSTNQNLTTTTTFARTSSTSSLLHPPYFRSDNIDNYNPQYSISQPNNDLLWDGRGHGSSSDALAFVHDPIQHPLMCENASSLSYLSSIDMVQEKCALMFPNGIKDEEGDNPLIYNGGFGVPYDVLIDGFCSSQAHNKVAGDNDQDAINPIRAMQSNFQSVDDYHGYNNVIVDINPQVLLQGDNIFKEIS